MEITMHDDDNSKHDRKNDAIIQKTRMIIQGS